MDKSYEKGQFGRAVFEITKKGITVPFDLFGIILDFDNKTVDFIDNDSYEYLIDRDKFQFTKEEFNSELQKVKQL